jgi:hypothetical protein
MTGPRMILYRGQRRAVVEPEDGVGVRLTGPTIKDLGFEKLKPTPGAAPAPKSAAPAAPAESPKPTP